ncbi:MAG: hypothetical protein A2506_00875 [Elusimicrobia bacterium RIFOXYD12_FULL_66_9]|nr:MAG: hypothetical protein A2506_00875 [Elusimicrobia bacterium RIFOXYD12_FULL_66_9]
MILENRIRLIAGTFVLLSLALAHWVNPKFLWFTAFVGANLIQSAFTRWCLMEDILRKVGLGGPNPCCSEDESCCSGEPKS